MICAADRRPLALGSFAAATRKQTNGPRLLQRRGLFLFAPPHGGAACFNLRLLQRRGPFYFLPLTPVGCGGFLFNYPARGKFFKPNFFTPVCCGGLLFHYPARGKFFKLFYACLLRRTIKEQAPLTSYSPTAEMQKQSPAAKGSSPRFHLKCPPPARTRSTSSPSVNSL